MTASSTGLLQRILAVLFPARCVGCRLRGVDLCPACRAAIPWLGSEVCPYCARPSRLARVCGVCNRDGPVLDGVRAACRFDGLVRAAVHDLKYRRIRSRATVLADLLVDAVAARPLALDALIPVPLAASRLRRRGFNQAELVAAALGRGLGIPVLPGVVRRTRDTAPQVGRSAQQRRENMVGAFACQQPAAVLGLRVGLVDDVMTTGATMAACASALRAAGASRVSGLVVAREI